MPPVPTLVGILIFGALLAFAFAFTVIGLVGEALALIALLGLLAHVAQFAVRGLRRGVAQKPER